MRLALEGLEPSIAAHFGEVPQESPLTRLLDDPTALDDGMIRALSTVLSSAAIVQVELGPVGARRSAVVVEDPGPLGDRGETVDESAGAVTVIA